MEVDVALVGDLDQQTFTVHRADCPEARAAADRGKPVMTMFGVERIEMLKQYDWHGCMATLPVLDH